MKIKNINKDIFFIIFFIVLFIIIVIFVILFLFLFFNRKKKIIEKNKKKITISENRTIFLEYNILEKNNFDIKKYDYNILNKNSIFTFDTNDYLDKTELFLKNYKYNFNEKLKKHISIYIKNQKSSIINDKNFNLKTYLKNSWKLGLFILNSLETQRPKDLLNYINFFKLSTNSLVNYCKKERKNLLKKHDWFLFASYYPTVLLYKLTIEYKLKETISKEILDELFYFIPHINFSLNIQRYNSNMQILSINYIMGMVFKLNNNKIDIDNFLKKIDNKYNLDSFLNNYVKENDGLYPNGGFIIHNNFCSYNYLLASLYPNIFYNLFFNTASESISRILHSLFKLINFKIKKCNPVIVTRFGNFEEIYNTLYSFNEHVIKLNVFKENKLIILLNKYLYNLEEQTNYLIYIDYFDIINVFYNDWCIQLKNNNFLAYGEIDKENNNIIKQISMNKILLFENINITKFSNHSKYPGVMFYNDFKDESEIFQSKTNTKTFYFEKSKFSNGVIFENLYFIYSRISNKELKLEYSEIVFFLPEGIIVGYLDIKKYLNQDLFLCINNNIIYKNNIKFGILYDDILNNQIINENDKYHYIKINKNIIYYNFYLDKLFKLNFYNDKNSTKLSFIYKNKNININIESNYKILISIN